MNLIYILLVFFIFFIIYYIHNNNNTNYPIEVKKSNISGLGVFATRDIKKGEIVEICPCVEDLDINFQGVILNYVFTSDNENKSVVVFGYGSIYNHQDDYDVEWEIKNGNTMIITAIKDIPKGKEIYNNYGDEYWEERNDIQKIII